jgi:hypothetical protein
VKPRLKSWTTNKDCYNYDVAQGLYRYVASQKGHLFPLYGRSGRVHRRERVEDLSKMQLGSVNKSNKSVKLMNYYVQICAPAKEVVRKA